jgi:hypothetical protein
MSSTSWFITVSFFDRSRLDELSVSSSQISKIRRAECFVVSDLKIRRAECLVVSTQTRRRFSSSSIKIRRAEKSSSRFRLDELYCRHQTRRVLLSLSDLDLMKLDRVEYFLVFLLSLVLLFASLFLRIKEISSFAFARKLIVSTLMSTTYNIWIIEMKNIAVRSRVWEYVNSKESESE